MDFFLVLLAVPLFGDVLKHEIEIETINTKSMIYNIIGDTDFIYGLNVNKFVQDVDIFVWLDELDKFDKITHAWIGFNYSP